MGNVRSRIAANIKRFRKEAGLSVDEVGAALDKSGKTISAWEVGRGQPDADETIILCRLLGIELLELYGEAEEQDEQEKRLIEIFRCLNKEGKTALLASAEGMRTAFSDKRKESK